MKVTATTTVRWGAPAASICGPASGATAKETILIAEVGNIPRFSCGQVTAAGLRIYPPNPVAARVVPFPFDARSHGGAQYLQVRPVQK
jgi:hypothetical protein